MVKFGRFVMALALVVALGAAFGTSAQAQDGGREFIVTLEATPFAEGAGLAGVTGWAHVRVDEGSIHIALEPNGAELPAGSVLEGWVVDAGLDGGPGETNASDADEAYGTPFGNADFDAAVEAAPYALSTGVLTPTGEGTWEAQFSIPAYNFSPYDAVVITLESDGNSAMGFDPRPGAPVFVGAFADGTPPDSMMGDDSMGEDSMGDDSMNDESMGEDSMSDDSMDSDADAMGDESMGDMMMGAGVEVTLEPTDFAEGAGLAGATGTATVYVDEGAIDITITLNDAMLPENTVLEGWVVDAGLDGGPGMTNVTDDDEAYGTPFGDAAFDQLVESAPYALSTGAVHDNMDGTYTLSFHVPAYNFSPYDAVVVTLESDGNSAMGFDPRPGAPVLVGAIAGEGM